MVILFSAPPVTGQVKTGRKKTQRKHNQRGKTMTIRALNNGGARESFQYGGLWYIGRPDTIGEVAELAWQLSREQLRKVLAHAVARGVLAIL